MTTDPNADRSLELLRHSARVSPILRDAVAVVASEVATLRAENERLRTLVQRVLDATTDFALSDGEAIVRIEALLASVSSVGSGE